MRFRTSPGGGTGRDQAYDTRSGNPVLQGARNSDGSQTLHLCHRRVERRLHIRRARNPADTVPRSGHGPTGEWSLTYVQLILYSLSCLYWYIMHVQFF